MLEVFDSFADAFGYLGNFLTPEEKNGNRENHYQFARTQVKRTSSLKAVRDLHYGYLATIVRTLTRTRQPARDGLVRPPAHEALGYFNPGAVGEPLRAILDGDVQIATFKTRVSEFCQAKRGEVLERTGQERAYRFRFHNPLLVPFVFLDAVAHGLVTDEELAAMLGSTF